MTRLDMHEFRPEVLTTLLTAETKSRGVFTVVSKATGKDFTFQIDRTEWKGRWYTHVRVEKGYLEFGYVGSYFNGVITRKKQQIDTPASKAIAWVLRQVQRGYFERLEESITLLHLGKCIKCNRPLTDAESIEIGMGAVCRRAA